jgi:hypothetical protein
MREVTVSFCDPLGVEFSIRVPHDRLYDAVRHYGGLGCTSGRIPNGGLRLPLANEADFDWRLLGAERFVMRDQNGDEMVMVRHRGHVYKRRELEENKKFNLKKVIKYSRGAKSTDPVDVREGEENGTQYVTLAVFANDRAPKVEHYAVPNGGGAHE